MKILIIIFFTLSVSFGNDLDERKKIIFQREKELNQRFDTLIKQLIKHAKDNADLIQQLEDKKEQLDKVMKILNSDHHDDDILKLLNQAEKFEDELKLLISNCEDSRITSTMAPITISTTSTTNTLKDYVHDLNAILSPCKFSESFNDGLVYCDNITISGQQLFEKFHQASQILPENLKHLFYLSVSPDENFQLVPKQFKYFSIREVDLQFKSITNISDEVFEESNIEGFHFGYQYSRTKGKIDVISLKAIAKQNFTYLELNNIEIEITSELGLNNFYIAVLYGTMITRFESHSFKFNNKINSISFYLSNFTSTLPDYAFTNSVTSNDLLNIDFSNGAKFNQVPFSKNTFRGINRRTTIYFGYLNGLTYLDEKVFKDFLLENDNSIHFSSINCSDSRNQWFLNDQSLRNKTENVNCYNY